MPQGLISSPDLKACLPPLLAGEGWGGVAPYGENQKPPSPNLPLHAGGGTTAGSFEKV
ncbi:hypothetical protein HDE77_001645 [Rhodanobacter sp. MP7CTX1]|nr:hypothetical protein [Rhodanobacter sp. MP7CTX1]